jgi:hypothetical protein
MRDRQERKGRNREPMGKEKKRSRREKKDTMLKLGAKRARMVCKTIIIKGRRHGT